MTRKNLFKYAILVGLFIFVPMSALVRRFTRSQYNHQNRYGSKKSVDQISNRISIPEDVQGQVGFKATVSKDGCVIAVVGNPVTDGRLFGSNIGAVPDGEYVLMYALRAQFYVAETPFEDFRFLWKSRNTSFASSIAISPAKDQLAALVYEFPFEHFDSIEEAAEIFKKDEKAREQYIKDIKRVFGQGYEANVYLIDINTGNCRKLANLFVGRQPSDDFFRMVNERALTWDSTGNLLLSHDYDYVFSIDMSGQRKNIFKLNEYGIFSSLFCDSDNTLSMVVVEKGGGQYMIYDGPSSLIQINLNGDLLKKEPWKCPPCYSFEENNITFVGKDKLIFFGMGVDSAKLHERPRTSDLEHSKSGRKSTFFYDRNDVIFYYAVYGEFPETGEVLFAKKRYLGGTPYSMANKDVPWVELRRFSSNSLEIE